MAQDEGRYDALFQFGIGRAWQISPKATVYAMTDAAAHSLEAYLRLRPHLALLAGSGDLARGDRRLAHEGMHALHRGFERAANATGEPLHEADRDEREARDGRTEFQRAILGRSADGKPTVKLTGSQGAGILRSMSEANCFVILGHEQGNVAAGDWVDIALFDGLL